MYEHFLKKKVEVEDADKHMSHRCGELRRPGPYEAASGRIFVTGLAGSGRRELAAQLAARLGIEVVDATAVTEAISPQWSEALGRAGVVIVPSEELAADAAAQAAMREAGKVVFLMADVPLLAGRLGEPDREALARRHQELEPRLMAGLHVLVPAELPIAAQVERIRESLQLAS